MPRIFTKKAFVFVNPETKEEVKTKALDFAEVPYWAAKDPMFGWAKADGDLEIIGTDKKAKKAADTVTDTAADQ